MKTGLRMLVVGCLLAGLSYLVQAADQGAAAQPGEKRAEKIGELKQQREAKFAERLAQWQKKHDDFITAFKARLARNARLPAALQTEIIDFFENQYQENVTFFKAQHTDNMAFLDQLAADPTLTGDQLREKIKAYVQGQRAEVQEHRGQQQTDREAERDKIKNEVKH